MNKCINCKCPIPATCKCRKIRYARVPIICLIGGTGAGKLTQSKLIADKFNLNRLGTGALLRKEIEKGSEKGKEWDAFVSNGKYISDDIAVEILDRPMRKCVRKNPIMGFVLSGFPKTIHQIELFEMYIGPIDLIILLECSEEILLQRTAKRSDEAGIDARHEDSESLARNRIEKFGIEKIEIMQKFAERLSTINAENGIEEVFEQIVPIVEKAIEVKAEQVAAELLKTEMCDTERKDNVDVNNNTIVGTVDETSTEN